MNKQLFVSLLGLVVLLTLGLTAASATPVLAQEPVSDDEVNAIAKELYCPVCENTPLDVCATQACQDWRDEIRTQLAEGRSREEIHQYFVDRYGAKVLSTPPQEGFNWLIWVLPIVLAIGGVIFFAFFLRGLQAQRTTVAGDDTFTVTQAGAQAPPPAADDDDYLSRVEKELRE